MVRVMQARIRDIQEAHGRILDANLALFTDEKSTI